MYTAMYLPVDRPWESGCTYIDASGANHVWDADELDAEKVKERGKVAELFIVGTEFNQLKIIGQPAELHRKWVKAGMEFKKFNVVPTGQEGEYGPIVACVCDVCGHMGQVAHEKIVDGRAIDAIVWTFMMASQRHGPIASDNPLSPLMYSDQNTLQKAGEEVYKTFKRHKGIM